MQYINTKPILENSFSLLCWNVHKEMGRKKFNNFFLHLQHQYYADLILLQEATLDSDTSKLFPRHHYKSANNIRMWKKSFGVLTASTSLLKKEFSLKTIYRELHIMTKKTLLITSHKLANGSKLTVVNLHAINFVRAGIFIKEMDRLLITLNDIRGPLIVAGDFNTWSDKRLIHLDSFAKNMGLKIATLQDDKYIKKLFFKPLDHIYYRELELLEAVVIDTKKISDHNPIYASFTILNHHKSNG